MKKIYVSAFVFVLLINVLAPLPHTFAAPDPSEVKEIKENSPLHVRGVVRKDEMLRKRERSYPSQLRQMQLKIDQVIKKPSNLELKSGDSFKITYSYVPSWVQMEGGKRMDIMVGDQIEIWLERGENGWEPALGGNTVNHLKYVEQRKEHIPEPLSHRVERFMNDILPTVVIPTVVIIGLPLILFVFIFIVRKLVMVRRGYYK